MTQALFVMRLVNLQSSFYEPKSTWKRSRFRETKTFKLLELVLELPILPSRSGKNVFNRTRFRTIEACFEAGQELASLSNSGS